MAHLELDLDSELPPERIIEALTDFSERRPDLWPGLSAKEYRVYAVGDMWADVREGSGGSIWARERYDWSRSGNVTYTVQESGFCRPGDFVSLDIRPRDGGSHLHVTWERRGSNLIGKAVVAMIVLTRGGPVRGSVESGLRRIAGVAPS